ncbi:hypothetical protein [Desertivirga brevis]|uniref:hypothetical protein n=1 Tax=Desertivirga brevis TaxID=2810310 RepID=UPI001A966DF9|nr:hypothetical protein [Pedobacter sp. SYSU D00873]
MKQLILLLTFLTTLAYSSGQTKVQKETSKILEEGKMLYKSEMASWYGTDLFLEKFSDQRANIGGYLSYTEKDISKCVFFSKSKSPKIIGTVSFDSTYNVKTAKAEGLEREFTETELALYSIRKKALSIINTDTLFKQYQNTNLNLIPIISNKERKVYVLTGPKNNGVVIIGNDYLLKFDKQNNIIEKKQLHKNIIPINYGKGNEVAAVHSHLPETGDFITPTDICTLMLYEKFAKWKQHYVISKNYVSIWDCEKDILAIMTRAAWNNMNKAK